MENLRIFMAKFPKFDIKYTAFFRKKKKKTGKIQNEQSVAVNFFEEKFFSFSPGQKSGHVTGSFI